MPSEKTLDERIAALEALDAKRTPEFTLNVYALDPADAKFVSAMPEAMAVIRALAGEVDRLRGQKHRIPLSYMA